MPESSAIAGRPVAAAAARALPSALWAKVVPVSGGSSIWSGSGSTSCGRISDCSSRSLWGLRVARIRRTALRGRGADRLHLGRPQLLDAGRREGEQLVERRARERRPLGRGLDLDEATVAGHDYVG